MSCKALPPSWDLAPGRKARNSHQWCAEGRITPMAHLASPKIILPHEQLVQRTNMIMEMEKKQLSSSTLFFPVCSSSSI